MVWWYDNKEWAGFDQPAEQIIKSEQALNNQHNKADDIAKNFADDIDEESFKNWRLQ